MAGKRIIVFALFAVAALALALSARGGAEAQTYRPYNGYTLSSLVPGDATGTFTTVFSIPAPDYNYEDASMTTLLPVDGVTANGLEAPIGARVGTLDSSVMIGLLGGPCNIAMVTHFDLYNASVDIAVEDDNTSWIFETVSVAIPDEDSDGLPDYMEKYPWFLNVLFDPDGSGPLLPLQPRARLAGNTNMAQKHFLIQVMIFNPGQLTAAGGIYAQMGAEKGGPSASVLNNPVGGAELSTPGRIGDFCTPLQSTTTLFGTTQDNPNTTANEAGFIRQRNPAANTGILATGTHMAYNYSQSERNVDGDNFENDFDACRYTADTALWDPRSPQWGPEPPEYCPYEIPGDQDCDMLPSSCDPDDTVANPDIDNDGYSNTQDNCPFVANGCQDAACGVPFNPTWDNQADRDRGMSNTDLGPKTDAIGDVCDDSDDDGDEDGAGGLASPGSCNDALDNDDSLVTNCQAAVNDDVADDGLTPRINDGCPPVGAPEIACNNAVDDDLDGWFNDGCPVAGSFPEDGIDGNDPDCRPSMDSADWPPPAGTQAQNGTYWHGMPWDAECVGGVDSDLDGYCDALENLLGSDPNNGPETGAQCTDAIDDDGDGYVNDGCPFVGAYAESGADCLNATDDDPEGDGVANDGCPTIGVPESLVIDSNMTAAAALPTDTVAQSCSDGVDNDGDGNIDGADSGAAYDCDPADYAGDSDRDGYADGVDNCPSVWNPTQTNTDNGWPAKPTAGFPAGDNLGDACDTDDDADGFSDTIENYLPTDPLDRCRNVNNPANNRSDAWPLDINRDAVATVGDIINFSGNINVSVSGNPPTSWARSRLDFNADKVVTVADVLKYMGKIGYNRA